jgi:hypothetical protein
METETYSDTELCEFEVISAIKWPCQNTCGSGDRDYLQNVNNPSLKYP